MPVLQVLVHAAMPRALVAPVRGECRVAGAAEWALALKELLYLSYLTDSTVPSRSSAMETWRGQCLLVPRNWGGKALRRAPQPHVRLHGMGYI
jgi:hypothetical protein